MPKYKLKFAPQEFPNGAKKLLQNGYCVNDDPEHLWFDVISVLDGIAENRFHGVEVQDKAEKIPETWWKLMKLPAELEKEIRAFFEKNPEGEVEISW